MGRISIIIPVLNESKSIGGLVSYLWKEGADKLQEIIVVDGGSTDNTAMLAEAAGARVVLAPRPGRGLQMNLGAEQAKGRVFYFVHADTWPPVGFADDIERALAEGRLMGCYRYRFDSPALMLRINAWFTRWPFMWCQGGDKTFYIPKWLFWELGGYPDQFMEEYTFLKNARDWYPLHIIPKDVVVSARKYRHNSWLKVQLANLLVFNGWRLGLPPERLKRWYTSWLKY